ncbi:bifunctional riboflavin kinase/FAD synthetase [Halanaerobiaceae bacterium Z-7014]|uniref:Riboflavin biosynthesis protein n=1 Tax=Halonatronomonas betaini TaxID=2778430 RepID=A0A931F688_9FIRM|nr:bifunctional riboflavin kinase/FAD synthetase [Halonatronomonas betaini]MBF8436660.1 bifunctional riboflavin kinase/FAD synthetase [Halonatronomonas betaini]
MKVIYSNEFKEFDGQRSAIAIGSFDGIHRGHQAVINKTKEIARENNLSPAVFSFEPHPRQVLSPDHIPGFITSPEQKVRLLTDLNIDYYFCQEFTKKFAKKDFEEFVENILYKSLNIGHIVVGEDFSFGRGGSGNIEDLKELGEKFDFSVTPLSIINNHGDKISSTKIRHLISRGEMDEVKGLLGRYYTMAGKVVHGDARGAKLGFPTANLSLNTDYVLPAKGVYAGYVNYNGNRLRGVANFGHNPTFTVGEYRIEVFIIDLNKNLYGEDLEFSLVKYIRPEKKFDNKNDLIEAIKQDVLYSKEVLC